jgi:hypothetical protein
MITANIIQFRLGLKLHIGFVDGNTYKVFTIVVLLVITPTKSKVGDNTYKVYTIVVLLMVTPIKFVLSWFCW